MCRLGNRQREYLEAVRDGVVLVWPSSYGGGLTLGAQDLRELPRDDAFWSLHKRGLVAIDTHTGHAYLTKAGRSALSD